ncbi:MAG: hypothetical protein M0R33_14190 [Methylomonas sp.]|uniref:hypothetical protein n=1 Tax=Methylomonas sp. TaxID=418 RepID=UPI0025FEB2B7|nr:hypothetical protein [Methylomonas sp.]MCK9607587.1 hypothetical protein [Methylomonas sp.]
MGDEFFAKKTANPFCNSLLKETIDKSQSLLTINRPGSVDRRSIRASHSGKANLKTSSAHASFAPSNTNNNQNIFIANNNEQRPKISNYVQPTLFQIKK